VTIGQIRPPLDPELREWLAERDVLQAVELQTIESMREIRSTPPLDEDLLTRGITHEEYSTQVGALPTVSVFRPSNTTGLLPGIFFLHGGGMVAGDRFTSVETAVVWVERL
jgi:acetyl esterase/lipase